MHPVPQVFSRFTEMFLGNCTLILRWVSMLWLLVGLLNPKNIGQIDQSSQVWLKTNKGRIVVTDHSCLPKSLHNSIYINISTPYLEAIEQLKLKAN